MIAAILHLFSIIATVTELIFLGYLTYDRPIFYQVLTGVLFVVSIGNLVVILNLLRDNPLAERRKSLRKHRILVFSVYNHITLLYNLVLELLILTELVIGFTVFGNFVAWGALVLLYWEWHRQNIEETVELSESADYNTLVTYNSLASTISDTTTYSVTQTDI